MYFKKFPLVEYSFGNSEANVLFPNISAYVDIVDQVKTEVSFYQKYDILDGDRPDIVSQKLYGRPDYHWTFWAMNDHIRESGWPMPEAELREVAKTRYPHRTVTTETPFATLNFKAGVNVVGKTSGTTGRVISRNLDLGQIVIASDKNEAGLNNNFGSSEQVAAGDTAESQNANIVTAIKESVQYDAVLYYKNSSGTIVDINPHDQTSAASLTPVTVLEDMTDYNDRLKQIIVIKPNQVHKVVNEYFKLLQTNV